MKRFAAFDIDGTIIRWQLYHAVVDSLAKAGYISEDSMQTVRTARMRWKNREAGFAFTDYERVLIDAYEASAPSIDTEAFDTIVSSVLDRYKNQVYVYTRDLITSLKQQNYLLFAISGSHAELVQGIAKTYGFDDYIGTVYERKQGNFTGKSHVGSHNKDESLKLLVKKHGASFKDSIAVGDSKSDIAMLQLVDQPIAFNPDKGLFEWATTNHRDVVVERKNVIYTLQYQHGTYILAKTGE